MCGKSKRASPVGDKNSDCLCIVRKRNTSPEFDPESDKISTLRLTSPEIKIISPRQTGGHHRARLWPYFSFFEPTFISRIFSIKNIRLYGGARVRHSFLKKIV